ncbi:MAG: glycosyltransferase, partial [Pseudomonadota bacterium]|nr:glycosyltransferase [Pseudomonadota bacterium]
MINQFSILQNNNKKQHVESIVAMAVYQADNAKWLREAIESITEQSYTDFLFVIVADGPVPQKISRVLEDVASKDDRVIIASNSHNVG